MANEKRLIDANALEQHCKNTKIIELFPEWKDIPYEMKNALIRYGKSWKEIIQNTPTVDAVEVVHGRWIETLVPDGYVQKASRMRKQCSVCGWTNACRYNYCPNCGAKMDGERKDDHE